MVVMIWFFLFLLTLARVVFAATGHFSGQEAYLMLCAERLDWGFVDGPAGIAALIRSTPPVLNFAGYSLLGVRFLSPCFLFLCSYFLWLLLKKLQGREVALWSILAFNLLPLTNAAALLMDGVMVRVTFWLGTLAWAWLLMVESREDFLAWSIFGLLLALGTQVSYAIGWLLPALLLLMMLRRQKVPHWPLSVTLLLLALGWAGPLYWNATHDWLQWATITWGSFWSYQLPPWHLELNGAWFWLLLSLPLIFGGSVASVFAFFKKKEKDLLSFLALLIVPLLFFLGGIGHDHPSFDLQLLLMALLLPFLVDFFMKTEKRKKSGLLLLLCMAIFSLMTVCYFLNDDEESDSTYSLSSPRGVEGVQRGAVELLRLRALLASSSTNSSAEQSLPPSFPFIIAQCPQLAALLGVILPIHYPELQGAPSVFTPESPSFSSQFQLWPHYADATLQSTPDPLYTQEPRRSPFLGHDALYITRELEGDLPETITGAFASVLPISEVSFKSGKGRFIIYKCTNYQMMSL